MCTTADRHMKNYLGNIAKSCTRLLNLRRLRWDYICCNSIDYGLVEITELDYGLY